MTYGHPDNCGCNVCSSEILFITDSGPGVVEITSEPLPNPIEPEITNIGNEGPVGAQGSTGFQGLQGFYGSQGTQGLQGPNAAITFGATPPTNPLVGDRWVDSNSGLEYTWLYDGNSYQWVEVSASGFLGAQGTQGPSGLPGPQGVQGTTGIQGFLGIQGMQGTQGTTPLVSFVYTQSPASDTWVIEHNLSFYPNITVLDSAGTILEGDISYTNSNSLTLYFSASFSGTAYLS